MPLTYKYIPAPKTVESGIQYLQNELVPMFDEYWTRHGEKIYGEPAALQIPNLFVMWKHGGLAVVIAYENNKPVGFMFGIRFCPVTYRANALQLELWHCRDAEVEQGMFNYLFELMPLQDITEFRITSDVPLRAKIPWKKKNTFTLERYMKE